VLWKLRQIVPATVGHNPMRIVLDTNVIDVVLHTSKALLTELREVIARLFMASKLSGLGTN
jgi:predicted nucleic acid-binding protein